MRARKGFPLDVVSRMVSLAQAGHTCDEIANSVGRHRASVRSKLLSLGVPFKQVPKQLWTEQELSAALDMRAQGCTFEEVGKALGRSATRDKLTAAQLHVPEVSRTLAAVDDPRPSQEVLDARDYRREMGALRSIGAVLMGDPPPGFSALDQKLRYERVQA
jgi:hypothetical protein